ncbi:hypothetical protein [Corynebacterium propinquum]|uniref:CdiI immunity protein domain-containing protein n=1 Tax=Corynebacterium propinquum TaxID=43769 RepID=A0ABT7G545_9CORY|nr:hypothetical protein [Corynebacterium propinquum]MDK4301661.1 hypothetical protein [Corynebacterium propinquum]MDK4314442.1 hypothetical protein [Corynebacterium propinquum]WKS48738.1 hypothetical protein NLL32_08315 [Corynebacterium propinquum]
MAPSIYGIDANDAYDDDEVLFNLWQEFLTDYLQEFKHPDEIDKRLGGEFVLVFEDAVISLMEEDIMISEQWLDVLEAAIYLDPRDREKFAEYAKRVRAYHAKARA